MLCLDDPRYDCLDDPRYDCLDDSLVRCVNPAPPIEEVWFYVVWVQQKKINIENTVRKRVIILKSKQSLQQTIRRTTRTISPSYPCAVSSDTAILSSQRLVHPGDLT